jgi:DNA polymerase (family 10)
MTNSEIAEVFQQIAEILEIKGENPFKIRAYLNAAAVIGKLGENLSDIVSGGEHLDVPGIGKDLSLKIKELVDTGRLAYYDELVKSVPEGLLELTKLRGLGPKKANLLYNDFNIKGIEELDDAIKSNKLSGIHGLGQKTVENLKKSIEDYKIFKQRFLYIDAFNQAFLFEAYLKNTLQKLIGEIRTAGSLRRKMETVGDIDIVVSVLAGKEKQFSERFLSYPEILRVESAGETKISVILKSGIHVDLRIVQPVDFVYALHHFTGSKLHNEELRSREKKRGYKINEYGIFMNNENKIAVNNEIEFYDVFGMQFIPPELREGTGEIEAALSRSIPVLVEEGDIRGVFHIHTTYTDGKESLEEMIESCIKQ